VLSFLFVFYAETGLAGTSCFYVALVFDFCCGDRAPWPALPAKPLAAIWSPAPRVDLLYVVPGTLPEPFAVGGLTDTFCIPIFQLYSLSDFICSYFLNILV